MLDSSVLRDPRPVTRDRDPASQVSVTLRQCDGVAVQNCDIMSRRDSAQSESPLNRQVTASARQVRAVRPCRHPLHPLPPGQGRGDRATDDSDSPRTVQVSASTRCSTITQTASRTRQYVKSDPNKAMDFLLARCQGIKKNRRRQM